MTKIKRYIYDTASCGLYYKLLRQNIPYSPLDDPGKKKIRCTPRGTKVVIYHLVGNFMLNSSKMLSVWQPVQKFCKHDFVGRGYGKKYPIREINDNFPLYFRGGWGSLALAGNSSRSMLVFTQN